MKNELPVHYELSYKVYGICFATQNELGRFRNEQEYSDCIERYLQLFKIPYVREKNLPPSFPGEAAGRNRVDFLVDNRIVIEVKAKRMIERADYYQVRRYLVAMDKKLGLLVNFRDRYLKPRRVLNSQAKEE